MRCPFCEAFETKVVDSRINQSGDLTRRRRQCTQCGGRFTTYERVEYLLPEVIKKDGRREPFNRSKIFDGVTVACRKRPITVASIENLVAKLEQEVQAMGLKEIASETIGQMVMQALRELDKVAYVRFASVYRDFQDIDDFVAEIKHTSVSTPMVEI